jgi:HEPN domain-containing protein
MGLPQAREAREYYRAAKQRFLEAELLLKARMKTGAVYLAGYTVKCFLKALILDQAAPGLRKKLLAGFRGRQGHDIEWLRELYRGQVGGTVPREIARHLMRAATWGTHLRYTTAAPKPGHAEAFIRSAAEVAKWAEGRM